jgi:hypothetical protein
MCLSKIAWEHNSRNVGTGKELECRTASVDSAVCTNGRVHPGTGTEALYRPYGP